MWSSKAPYIYLRLVALNVITSHPSRKYRFATIFCSFVLLSLTTVLFPYKLLIIVLFSLFSSTSVVLIFSALPAPPPKGLLQPPFQVQLTGRPSSSPWLGEPSRLSGGLAWSIKEGSKVRRVVFFVLRWGLWRLTVQVMNILRHVLGDWVLVIGGLVLIK